MFRSSFLQDKAPVIVLKDVDFENLKALVEYMYKGEANVPQHMLQSFIRTAESLQIRGLAEGATKHFENESPHMPPSMPLFPPPGLPTPPINFKNKNNGTSGGGILAARLKHSNPEFTDFNQADLMFPRPPASHQPPMKKPRKFDKDNNKKSKSPVKKSSNNSNQSSMFSSNSSNNYDDETPLKIDEDSDAGKENNSRINNSEKEDDIVELDNSNGVGDSDEEEPSISGPSQVPDLPNPSLPRKIRNAFFVLASLDNVNCQRHWFQVDLSTRGQVRTCPWS